MTSRPIPKYWEQQYNPTIQIPDTTERYARWTRWAELTRGALPHAPELNYGRHPRESIDLFRAPSPRGVFMFVHGGYWRAFSKNEFSWVADPFVASGFSVAVLNYPLCPQVSIEEISRSCRRAVVFLWQILGEAERVNFVICGHSAGAHLVATAFTTDWAYHGLPSDPFRGALAISGIYDLTPIVHTSMNADIKLTEKRARLWSMAVQRPTVTAPFLLAVGGDETGEFHRQSINQAAAWRPLTRPPYVIPGRNHFSVVEDLRCRETPSFELALSMLD
ncbi:hypothetical protein B1987_21340 [Mycobacterium kansasii]|uniref:BD-FAE-like domain-containing protein n=2 Tax=Mycobacterium attenuatum TaxID=2341086 RepID=A0A498PTX0_9MYCO|nr:hypothetical protein B1987_21340 [Mycobacterium kansasii]VBA36061.1 hypothetical protein LAUMK136_01253 [Mycobacterium attenuatum]